MRNTSIILILITLFIQYTTSAQKMKIKKPEYFDVSKPLTNMSVHPQNDFKAWKNGIVKNEFRPEITNKETAKDGALKNNYRQDKSATITNNFEGVSNLSGVAPPDPNGDVGISHYVQMVNSNLWIFDKQGNPLYGPIRNSVLWDGFVGPWTGTNDGDPVVLYDEQADRWLLSQFAVNTGDGSQWELVAVSASNDPLGQYYRYAYHFDDMPDYPHFGIWHDGYYLSVNRFPAGGSNGFGPGIAALDRDKMLTGDPNAQMVLFELDYNNWRSFLPADCNGDFPTPGTPNYFFHFTDDNSGWSKDALELYEFHVDWLNPENSTFVNTQSLDVASFNSVFNQYREAIHQPNGQGLDQLSDRLLQQVYYRKFETHESIVLSHTVNTGNDLAGVRWYELRRTGGDWFVHQQSTFNPDTDHRWMGSVAINAVGDIAIGYTVSSDTTYPSIRFTGRNSEDSLNQMTFEEGVIFDGYAAQSGVNRWGDYTMMTVDPADHVSFWFNHEYSTGDWSWRTRIASFLLDDFGFPLAFSAKARSNSKIVLNWEKNQNQNSVLVAMFNSNNFGNPENGISYNIGDTLVGGATICYIGSADSIEITQLTGSTDYYFKAWSLDTALNYSLGVVTTTTTFCEPNNTLPFYENFESAVFNNCWWQEPDVIQWGFVSTYNTMYPSSAYQGEYFIRLKDGIVDSTFRKLVLPSLDLSSLSEAYICFWHYQKEGLFSPNDQLRLFYKNGYEGEWTKFAEFTENTDVWTKRFVQLPSISSNYIIALEANALGSHGVSIDELRVGDESIGIDHTDLNTNLNFEVFPNPIHNETFTIRNDSYASQEASIIISNIYGQHVHKIENYKFGQEINVAKLPKGSYFLMINIADSQYLKKIVIH